MEVTENGAEPTTDLALVSGHKNWITASSEDITAVLLRIPVFRDITPSLLINN
jgi:hypothetical protein